MKQHRFFNLHTILLLFTLPLILYYIYDQLQDGWEKLGPYKWSLNVHYLLLAVFTAIFYFALGAWIWGRVLSYLGSELGFWKSFRILQIAQLGKYLPGRIWAIGGQLYLGEQEGIASRTLIWATGLHWFFNLLTGAIIFLPYFYVLAPRWVAGSVTLTLLLLLGLVCFPRRIPRLLSRWFYLGNSEKPPFGLPSLSASQILRIVLSFFLAWALFGFAFWFLINVFMELSFGAYYEVLASFCGAWVLGAVSFFTPAGLGVREGALVYLLGQFLLPSMAVIISIAARLWITVVELICAGVAWLIQ